MIEEEKTILVGKETGLPIVSALDDVNWQSSSLKARLAWHARNYITESQPLSKGSVPEVSPRIMRLAGHD